MKAVRKNESANAERTVSQVVEGMHKHFRENGYYRAEDVRRVFGDPAQSVEIRLSNKMHLVWSR